MSQTKTPDQQLGLNALLSAYRNDARFAFILNKVKQWGGCSPINPGKENDPTVMYAVKLGAITISKERLGPLGIYTGQMCLTLTDAGWELVGR